MMRCNPWRWLWGLIPVAMIGWVAVQGHRESIERDLTERVRTILDRNGLTWATVRFTGRDGVLSGRSMEDGGPEKAVESTSSIARRVSSRRSRSSSGRPPARVRES
jgi:OOP family OmpA-OmpF porin